MALSLPQALSLPLMDRLLGALPRRTAVCIAVCIAVCTGRPLRAAGRATAVCSRREGAGRVRRLEPVVEDVPAREDPVAAAAPPAPVLRLLTPHTAHRIKRVTPLLRPPPFPPTHPPQRLRWRAIGVATPGTAGLRCRGTTPTRRGDGGAGVLTGARGWGRTELRLILRSPIRSCLSAA